MFGNVNVDYKPCKSVKQLRRACNYILGRNPEQLAEGVVKTADNLYYAFDCNRDNFADEVLLTRRLFGKSADGKSNLAYKMSISFHPDDNDKLSYEEAFRIAAEFARRFFYDKGYDVLFAVHTDREHIHVHFIIGNCHRETGKAFRRNQRDLYEMSEFFGEQCMKRGLTHSVREHYYSENPCRQKEKYGEIQMEKKGKETFKAELREAIEKEVADPRNHTFREEQQRAFASARAEVINSNKLLIGKVNAAANGAKQAAEYASATAEHIRRIEDWKELLFYLSPAVVIVDIVVRLIVYFFG